MDIQWSFWWYKQTTPTKTHFNSILRCITSEKSHGGWDSRQLQILPSKAESVKAGCPGPCQIRFWVSPRIRTPQSIPFLPSIRYKWINSSHDLSFPGWTVPAFSAFPHMKDAPSCKPPSHPFSGLTSVSPYLFFIWDLRTGSSILDEPDQCWVGVKDHLSLLAVLFLMKPGMPLSFWQGHMFTLVHQDPSWKAALQTDTSLFCCRRLCFSRYRPLCFCPLYFFLQCVLERTPQTAQKILIKTVQFN